jgi:hypothetical protein
MAHSAVLDIDFNIIGTGGRSTNLEAAEIGLGVEGTCARRSKWNSSVRKGSRQNLSA